MIVGTFNVRGLGGRIKKRRVREVISSNHLDFVALQETKLEVVFEALVFYLWGNTFCEWSFFPSVGNSGGMLSIWCKFRGKPVFSFVGSSFLGVCLEWGVSISRCYLVNVYSGCALRDKRAMWTDLQRAKRSFGGDIWCVLGYFNSVLSSDERVGVSPVAGRRAHQEMGEFGGVITSLELIDLPLLGRRYMWFKPHRIAMSRLDRILISEGWWDLWGVVY